MAARRSDTFRTQEFVSDLQEKILKDPGKSMWQLELEDEVCKLTMERAVHEDLSLHFVFQQDSAPAHEAKSTQAWLILNVPHSEIPRERDAKQKKQLLFSISFSRPAREEQVFSHQISGCATCLLYSRNLEISVIA